MMLPLWHEEAIAKKHDRKSFDCGNDEINDFLQRYARQSHEQGGAKTFLAVDDGDPKRILGFYSLTPASLVYGRVPRALLKGLARHEVPGFRLARLAIHVDLQGHGLGGQLIAAAGKRCLMASTEVGGVILVIDAKSDRAAQWYASYGAIPLLDTPATLVMALATFANGLKATGQL
jgi:GNAT superfamily N-acetyltransferase